MPDRSQPGSRVDYAFDTIVALSSGGLPSGVAVIRASGPRVRFIIETVCGVEQPVPRKLTLTAFSSADGQTIDRGLVSYFTAPNSFTGEDVCEIHCHGGRAVVAALLRCLAAIPGCRLAEAGEFTRRAFLNGKMDMLAVEASADLIAAETEAQRRFAVENSRGQIAAVYADWRRMIIHARAMIEAELDFSDEGDVPGSLADTVWADMHHVIAAIKEHVAGYHKAEIVLEGYRVVLLGAPNAGKSSLLNTLAARDVAIVTSDAGTTRDALDVALDLDGVKVIVTDTAGIRTSASVAETVGIARSMERARQADLVLILEDVANPQPFARPELRSPVIRIGTKADLLAGDATPLPYDLLVSAKLKTGIDDLLSLIAAAGLNAATGHLGLPWKQRHIDLLTETVVHLQSAADVSASLALELRCEDLRRASESLGRISGAIAVDDLLDVIFSQFCIGK